MANENPVNADPHRGQLLNLPPAPCRWCGRVTTRRTTLDVLGVIVPWCVRCHREFRKPGSGGAPVALPAAVVSGASQTVATGDQSAAGDRDGVCGGIDGLTGWRLRVAEWLLHVSSVLDRLSRRVVFPFYKAFLYTVAASLGLAVGGLFALALLVYCVAGPVVVVSWLAARGVSRWLAARPERWPCLAWVSCVVLMLAVSLVEPVGADRAAMMVAGAVVVCCGVAGVAAATITRSR